MLVTPRKYSYNASYVTMTICAVASIVGAVFFTQQAMTNDRGLVIDYIIKLDTNWATGLYWFFTVFCVIGVLVSVLAMVRRTMKPRELCVEEDEMTVPHGLFQMKTTQVKYSNITDIEETFISRQAMLTLHTTAGKLVIAQSLLPAKDDYEDIKQFLIRKLQ